MSKIAIVGAGSLVFTRTIVQDLLKQEATADAEVRLVDIDPVRLERSRLAVEQRVAAAGGRMSVTATTDRAKGLRDSDYVVNTVQVGGKAATLLDFDLPEKYGVRQTIADTHGIGGISRAMRTLPAVLDIARTVASVAPNALFLNYTNPMAMVVLGLERGSDVRHVGLCHGTEHTATTLAGYLGVHPEELAWQAAGINHMTWFLAISVAGRDVYPQLREYAREADLSLHQDAVRLELLRRFGYFVSESSVHNAEYYPWFLRPGTTPPPGVRVREYVYRLEDLEREFAQEQSRAPTSDGAPSEVPQSSEYAPRVVAALEANCPYRFMGNVPNAGALVPNLPLSCCVEVPCFVDGGGLVPGAVGAIPEQCAALNRSAINVQLLALEGILGRRRDAVYQAALLDPLLSAQLSTDQTVALVDELIEAHGNPACLR
ncbi:MAG TPA: alpha-galactosidase [Acidimicrobiales bacterium]|nr:alpha-galactosidase [Acidimicrobiales bacterium]